MVAPVPDVSPRLGDTTTSAGAERPAIILDCDPGHDDAVAIVVAAQTTELRGITTVAGNAPLDRTTYNACVIRDLVAPDVDVHAGSHRPIVAEPKNAGFVHGESGLDGAELPAPTRLQSSDDAVAYLVDTCRAEEGIWLVPTGPLTNIALAFRLAPDLVHRIAGVSLMGGGTFGNRSVTAEFNIWADPEAAAIVYGSGVDLKMAGLDVTHQFLATPERIEAVRAIPGRLAAVLADLFVFFADTYRSRHSTLAGAAVHDPLAVMAVSHPELFTSSRRHVQIELTGELTRGMTVIDQRDLIEREEPNCDVLDTVDVDAAWRLINSGIAAAGDVP